MKWDLVPPPTNTAAPAPPAAPVRNGGDPQTPAAGAATTTSTGADDRNTAFRAVQGGNELQSGEKLLVEAYAAIWVILFALVLFSWRRQRGLDERMSTLSAAIDKARAQQGKGGD